MNDQFIEDLTADAFLKELESKDRVSLYAKSSEAVWCLYTQALQKRKMELCKMGGLTRQLNTLGQREARKVEFRNYFRNLRSHFEICLKNADASKHANVAQGSLDIHSETLPTLVELAGLKRPTQQPVKIQKVRRLNATSNEFKDPKVENVVVESRGDTKIADEEVEKEILGYSSESYHANYNTSLFGGSSPVCEAAVDFNRFQDPFQKCFLENTATRSKTVSTCHTVIRETVCYAIKEGKMKVDDPLLDMELPALVSKLLLCHNFTDTERTLLSVYAKNFRHAVCHSGRPLFSTFEFSKFLAGIVLVLHALARYPAVLSNKQGLRVEKEFIASFLEMKAMSKADSASFYTLIGATRCSDPDGLTVALLGSIQKADIVKSMTHHLEDIEDLTKEFLYRFFGYCTHDGDLLETLQQLLEHSSRWRDSFVTERRVFRLFPGVQAAQLISRYIRIVKDMGISKLLSLPEAVEFLSTPIELLIAFGVKPKRMIHFWDLYLSVTQSYLVNRDVIENPTSRNVTQSTTKMSRKVRISFKNTKGVLKVLNKDLYVALHWTVAEYLEKRELECGNGKEWLCEFSEDGTFHKDDEVFGLEGVGYVADIILSIVDKITLE